MDDADLHALAVEIDGCLRSPGAAGVDATVPLNLRAAGGTGDAHRTLPVCDRLIDDRDDMVVKALSWDLRELVIWDAEAVQEFPDPPPRPARRSRPPRGDHRADHRPQEPPPDMSWRSRSSSEQ